MEKDALISAFCLGRRQAQHTQKSFASFSSEKEESFPGLPRWPKMSDLPPPGEAPIPIQEPQGPIPIPNPEPPPVHAAA